MHLRVANLERSTRFYHSKIGLDINVTLGGAWQTTGRTHLIVRGFANVIIRPISIIYQKDD